MRENSYNVAAFVYHIISIRQNSVLVLEHNYDLKQNKHYLDDNGTSAAMFLKTVKIKANYGTPPSAKLYTVICQIGRSFVIAISVIEEKSNFEIFPFIIQPSGGAINFLHNYTQFLFKNIKKV